MDDKKPGLQPTVFSGKASDLAKAFLDQIEATSRWISLYKKSNSTKEDESRMDPESKRITIPRTNEQAVYFVTEGPFEGWICYRHLDGQLVNLFDTGEYFAKYENADEEIDDLKAQIETTKLALRIARDLNETCPNTKSEDWDTLYGEGQSKKWTTIVCLTGGSDSYRIFGQRGEYPTPQALAIALREADKPKEPPTDEAI